MNIADGFSFWVGKTLAEFAVVAAIFGGFALLVGAAVLYTKVAAFFSRGRK